MRLVAQSAILIFSFALVFGWQQTTLSLYTIPAIGFLIFLYLITAARRKKGSFSFLKGDSPWSIFAINSLILLLIFSTGDINSPIFFLLYFLGFGVAFVFEPGVVFVFIIGVILIFLPEVLKDDVTGNLLKIGSLLLISPLAFMFGREYRKSDQKDEETEALKERTIYAADTISEDVEEVLEAEKKDLKPKTAQKLNEILEETEDLREETRQ